MVELILPRHYIRDGGETIQRTQEITDEFLQECKDNRYASNHVPMGDFHQVAAIPTAVVDKWAKEGFDIFTASIKEIVGKLQKEDLTAFLTTDKKV